MRIQPAFLLAVVVSLSVPLSASADDEHHSAGVKTTEVGRLAGINLEQLSPNVRSSLQQILSVTDKLR